MKALITGAQGQLGSTLLTSVPAGIQVHALTRAQLDIGALDSLRSVAQTIQPDVIINAAAYTAVDKAESDGEAAQRGNVIGPRNLAVVAQELSARLIHVSTDFVFDGRKSTPYLPDDATAPLGVYGRSKRDGEVAVVAALGSSATIVRTAWVYSAQGKNFMNTMLRLMREHGAVRVVTDQVGTPTCTQGLAEALWRCAAQNTSGILHWTDAGVASWYDFAVAIAEEAVAFGVLPTLPKITPILASEYPTPAQRPAYSVLDKSATYAALQLSPVHWRARLRDVMRQLAAGNPSV